MNKEEKISDTLGYIWLVLMVWLTAEHPLAGLICIIITVVVIANGMKEKKGISV
jgi:hypothetical protein